VKEESLRLPLGFEADESAPPEKRPSGSAIIECTVCRREIPEKEYYATHINLHPCE
jgi:hypothetical protein